MTEQPCGIECRDHVHPRCAAALNIKGEFFACDYIAAHDGWAHASRAAEAIWDGGVA